MQIIKKATTMARAKFRRGDTLIEVIFAISVFSLVAVISLAAMNDSIETAQGSLEVTMARNEIDAQAEALRFIHNSFLSEREYAESEQVYKALWKRLTDSNVAGGLANDYTDVPDLNYSDCKVPYDNSQPNSIQSVHGFVVNTRKIDPANVNNTIIPYSQAKFSPTSLYPRIIYSNTGNLNNDQNSDDDILASGQKYTTVASAEGIWITTIAGVKNTSNSVYTGVPEYYDFHIRTCWYAPGANVPSTIGTIIRLYNPELLEKAK